MTISDEVMPQFRASLLWCHMQLVMIIIVFIIVVSLTMIIIYEHNMYMVQATRVFGAVSCGLHYKQIMIVNDDHK
jgi:hypothetical protein